MLPRNLHLEQINRFHDMLESVDKNLQNETISDQEKFILTRQYYRLTKFWSEIDDFVEFKVKNYLDFMIEDDNGTRTTEPPKRPDTTSTL